MDYHYCWNQPKKFAHYDFYLDGKIKADEFVYRKKNIETGKIDSFSVTDEIAVINERLKNHFTFETIYKSFDELESAFNNNELKETVIYVIENEDDSDNPDSKDKYNEYMIVSVNNDDGSVSKSLELIGSGSYTKQLADIFQITGYTGFDSFDSSKQDGKDINSRINKERLERISEVNEEQIRATNRENSIQEIYDSITGYSFEKVDISNSIDTRIKNEIERAKGEEERIESKIDNEIIERNAETSYEEKRAILEEKIIKDTVSSIFGLPFEKPGTVSTKYGFEEIGKENWADSKGFDTIINTSGYIDFINVYCRYAGITNNKSICLKLWKITHETENKFLIEYLGTSDNFQKHDELLKELKYSFVNNKINVEAGDKLRITFHDESQINVNEYHPSSCTASCIHINVNPLSSDFIILDNNGTAKKYMAKHELIIVKGGKSLTDEIIDINSNISDFKLEVYEDCVTKNDFSTQIDILMKRISSLEDRIVTLEAQHQLEPEISDNPKEEPTEE